MPRDDDRFTEELLRRAAPAGGTAQPCPDDNLLAGLAEGRLPDEQRARVEDHVSRCEACRETVAELARSGALEAAAPPRAGRLLGIPVRGWALAALLLVAVGSGVWSLLAGRDAPRGEVGLAAGVRELAAQRPDLFGDLKPLSDEELSGGAAEAERGGLVVLRPAGRVLQLRPAFAWSAVSGAIEYRITVVDEEGAELLARDVVGTELAFPEDVAALAEGSRYVASVTTRGARGSVEGTRAFTVVSPDERAVFLDAQRVVEARVPAPLRALTLAHVALRRGLLGEAEVAAREAVAARPDDPLAAKTLEHVLRRVGVPPGDR